MAKKSFVCKKKNNKKVEIKTKVTKKKSSEAYLASSKFRLINEKFYTTTSPEMKEIIDDDPELYKAYQDGFKQQSSVWPVNPLNEVIKIIRKKGPSKVIADMGCGEATLSTSVKNLVHSFDLHPVSKEVIACDFSNVPLGDSSVDIVVFCLSLMGTNILDFIKEAWRILKQAGELIIVEVSSRFKDPKDFVRGMKSLGFLCKHERNITSFFNLFIFSKGGELMITDSINKLIKLDPCLYKKR